MSQRNPEKILKIFDELEVQDAEERRICLFVLNEYFGAVFDDVGKQLDFRTSDFGMSIGHQWNTASSRLEKVDSVEIPREYNQTLRKISEVRGNYAHNFRDYPPVDPIESAREIAPEWKEWIREAAGKYEEFQESLTATEALVQVGERVLDDTLNDWKSYPPDFKDQAKNLHKQAHKLDRLVKLYRNDEEVTKRLVEIISEILEWERDKELFEREFRGWEEEIKRQERIDRAANTYNFLVIEEGDESGRIELAKHHPGESDTVISINIHNTMLSEEECDYLMGLSVDDQVRLRIGQSTYRDKQGNIAREDVIKEIPYLRNQSEN